MTSGNKFLDFIKAKTFALFLSHLPSPLCLSSRPSFCRMLSASFQLPKSTHSPDHGWGGRPSTHAGSTETRSGSGGWERQKGDVGSRCVCPAPQVVRLQVRHRGLRWPGDGRGLACPGEVGTATPLHEGPAPAAFSGPPSLMPVLPSFYLSQCGRDLMLRVAPPSAPSLLILTFPVVVCLLCPPSLPHRWSVGSAHATPLRLSS